MFLIGCSVSMRPPSILEVHHSGLHCLAQALRYLAGPDANLDGTRQLVRQSLQLPRESGKSTMGALLLAQSLLPEEDCGLPDSLGLTARRIVLSDKSPAVGISLVQELRSKKVLKMMKK